MQNHPRIDEFTAFADSLADVSRGILSATIGRAPPYSIKDDGSPVTPVDREVEQALRERIADRYPTHGVLGEEFGNEALDAEFVWVIDPIDGTKQFITGVPVFGTLIALACGGRFVYGVMDYPATRDRWHGGPGLGATLNADAVRTRPCNSVDRALFGAGMPTNERPGEHEAVMRLTRASAFTVWGGSSYTFGLVAAGRVDGSVDRGLDAFDFGAATAIIEGAGGHCCDWDGEPLTIASGSRTLLLGDAALAGPALEMLAL